MGANQGLQYQEDWEACSTLPGQIAHEERSTHGFLMRHNEMKEHTFSTRSPAMGKTPLMKAIGTKQNCSAVWTPDMVRRILKNEAYTGVYWVNRRGSDENGKPVRLPRENWKALTIERIIDQELWEEAKSLMARGRSIYAVNKRKKAYLMARRLECSCGKSIAAMTNYCGTPYYRCGSIDAHQRKTGQKCGLPHFRADRLDAAIWE